MTFQSILFERPEDRVAKDTPEAPVFFVDLNLDQIVEAITASRAEYNLKPFFYRSLGNIEGLPEKRCHCPGYLRYRGWSN